MATIHELEIKVIGLSRKIKELEKIPTSITELSGNISNLVTNETLEQKINSINAEIEKLKPTYEVETEKAKIKNQIIGKKNELWRKVFLWDKLKLFALVLTILLSVATFYVLKLDDKNFQVPTFKVELGAGLSLLAALSALLHLSFTLGNTKNSVNTYNKLKELESLEIDLTNSGMAPDTARERYSEIIKAN